MLIAQDGQSVLLSKELSFAFNFTKRSTRNKVKPDSTGKFEINWLVV